MRDLGEAPGTASVLIVVLYAWGGYERYRAHRTLARKAAD